LTSPLTTAKRLRLTAAEFAVLATAAPAPMPPAFTPVALTTAGTSDATASLIGRGVGQPGAVDETFAPRASIAADLTVLAGGEVTLDVEITGQQRRRRAWFSVAGARGVALVELADDGVELSAFPSVALGRELQRVVPEPSGLAGAASGITAALHGPATREPLSGTLPLSALVEHPPAQAVRPESALGGDDGQAAPHLRSLADDVARRTTGSLICRVVGRSTDALLIGQVQWLATAEDWIALRPVDGPDGERLVALHPVSRTSIGTWVAPLMAELLGATR